METGRQQAASQRSKAARRSRPAVTRTLQIIEAFAALGSPCSLAGLSRALSLPQATVFRLCERLEQDGYIVRDAGSRSFTLGPRLMRLALDIVHQGGPMGARHAILKTLVDRVGETCNLTTLAGTEVLYLDRVETRWPLRLELEPGSRVPIHCTASGKLFLASMPQQARQQILDLLDLARYAPNSIVSRRELEEDLQRIVRRGYSTDDEEFIEGLIAVAVPIKDRRGTTFAALACHAPTARLELRSAIDLVPLLETTAAKLAATFAR